MVRATWSGLPVDPEKQPEYIERILRESAASAVKEVLRHRHVRDLKFRSVNYRYDTSLTSVIAKLAAALYTRGIVAENPCEFCRQGGGPFVDCVQVPGLQDDRCANCVYIQRYCSCGNDHQSRMGSYVRCIFPSRTTNRASTTSPKKPTHQTEETDPASGVRVLDSTSSSVSVDVSDAGPLVLETPKHLNQFTILGDLKLPRPPDGIRERAEKLEGALRALDTRDMEDLHLPITSLDDSFKEFQIQEPAIWKSANQQEQSAAELVRPSGSLKSLIAHRLNQPSFTSQFRENGETADRTNGCTAMVMGNLYDPEKALLFDHIHRRDHQSEGIEQYPAEVLKHHEKFTDQIAQSMTAKVEIVYGAKVQQRLLIKQDFDVLPLWDEFEGVVLLLAHEQSYQNADSRFRFRRVMLMAYHPQFMFYHAANTRYLLLQDKVMFAATQMIRNRMPFEKYYFSKKAWSRHVPRALEATELKLFGKIIQKGHQRLERTITDDTHTQMASSTTKGAWDTYFYEMPHSNDSLRKLIPSAIQDLEECQPWGDKTQPEDLPPAVLEWFLGQKQILFGNTAISNWSDIVQSLKRILPQSTSEDLKQIFREILIYQQNSP